MSEAGRDMQDAQGARLDGRVSPARPKRTGEDRILTVPNVISFVRLVLIPVFFVVYVCLGRTVIGTAIFAVAAATDWLDGTVARSTGSVTKLGRALDPFIDRILLIVGIISVVATGRAL